MTDPISAQITINARRGGYGQSGGRLIMTMADHIDAQDTKIKALVDALGVYADPKSWVSNPRDQGIRTSQMDYDKGHRARNALAAAKETTVARPVTVAEAAKVLLDEQSRIRTARIEGWREGDGYIIRLDPDALRALSHEDDDTCTGCQGSGWDGNREAVCHCQPGE